MNNDDTLLNLHELTVKQMFRAFKEGLAKKGHSLRTITRDYCAEIKTVRDIEKKVVWFLLSLVQQLPQTLTKPHKKLKLTPPHTLIHSSLWQCSGMRKEVKTLQQCLSSPPLFGWGLFSEILQNCHWGKIGKKPPSIAGTPWVVLQLPLAKEKSPLPSKEPPLYFPSVITRGCYNFFYQLITEIRWIYPQNLPSGCDF